MQDNNINNTCKADTTNIGMKIKAVYPWTELLNDLNIKYSKSGRDELRIRAKDFPELPDFGAGEKKKIYAHEHSRNGEDHNGLMVNPATGISYDKISVYAIRNSISDSEAIRIMAEKKGIPLNTRKRTPNKLSNDIYNYYDTLNDPKFKGIIAQDLYKRGLDDRDINIDKIGYRLKDRRIILPTWYQNEEITLTGAPLTRDTYNALYNDYPYEVWYSDNSPCGWTNDYKNSKYKKAYIKYYADNGVTIKNEIPYNSDTVKPNSKEIYICEGMYDSWSLRKSGKANYCLTGIVRDNEVLDSESNKSKMFNQYIIPRLKQKDTTTILLGDNDTAGKNSVYNQITGFLIPNELFDSYVEIVIRRLIDIDLDKTQLYKIHFLSDNEVEKNYPNGCKDINDFYLENERSLAPLRKTRIHSLAYLGLHYNHEHKTFNDYYYQIINPIKRKLSDYQINTLIKDLKDLKVFSSEDIELLKTRLNTAPDDSEIVQAIKDKYEDRILYNPALGFYIFNGIVWESVDDKIIDNLISNELGQKFKKGNRLKPLRHLLECEDNILNPNIEFNKNDVVVFRNGTLYLNNGDYYFKEEHNPSDKMTFYSDFDYDPNAKVALEWQKFLSSSLEPVKGLVDSNFNNSLGDTEEIRKQNAILADKKRMLQEFTGYVLFGQYDTNLQNCLILLGNGSNGKTTFLNIIRKLFSDKAVTDVAIENLKDPVHAISLSESFLNISEEEKSSLYGSEKIIKRITAGDPITGRKYYHNPVEFVTRSKLIICGNNDFKIEDKSSGTERRFMFVQFPYHFTNPNNKLINIEGSVYKPKDYKLEEKLINELPAIFNWALDGYLRLKKNKEFTLSDEHHYKSNEFKVNNNPILDFIYNSEWLKKKIVPCTAHDYDYFCINSDVYDLYNGFKEINHYKSDYSLESFFSEFKRQLEALGFVFKIKKYYYNQKVKLHYDRVYHKTTGRLLEFTHIPDEFYNCVDNDFNIDVTL